MKRVGRNEPCPCGSGKKYKKCCLEKDQSRSNVINFPVADESAEMDVNVPDEDYSADLLEEDLRWTEFWDEFIEAPLDEKVHLAVKFIDEEKDLDGDCVFEMMAELHIPLQEAGRIDGFKKIIDKIKELHPEAYEEESQWFNMWLAKSAFFMEDGDLSTPLLELAENPGKGIDQFFNLIDQALYHGRTKEMSEAMLKAWPKVRDSSEIMSYGIDEFQGFGLLLLLCEHLDADAEFMPNDPLFLERCAPFNEGDPEWLEKTVLHLSGRSQRQWQIDDFAVSDVDLLSENLFLLSLDFAFVLYKIWDWPLSRAQMGAREFFKYIVERFGKVRKKKKTFSAKMSAKTLLPSVESAEEFLIDRLHLLGPQPYKAAVFSMLLIPWMTFLADLGFCDKEAIVPLSVDLREVIIPLPRILSGQENDPVMASDVQDCWGIEDIEMFENGAMIDDVDSDELASPFIGPDMAEELLKKTLESWRKEIESKALKPNTKLKPALKKQPAVWIEGICSQLAITDLRRVKERIEALQEKLPRDETLVSIWSNLPEKSRRMLQFILEDQGGHASLGKITRKFGRDEDSSWFWNEGQTPTSPLGLLRLHGLVFVGKAKINNLKVKIASVPVELREGLQNILGTPDAFDGAPPMPSPVDLSLTSDRRTFSPSDDLTIEIESLSEEEELSFISEFIDKHEYSKFNQKQYKWILERVMNSKDENYRDFLRKILTRMIEGGNATARQEAYKTGYREFGESFIEQALEDDAKSIRTWASNIHNPKQGKLF